MNLWKYRWTKHNYIRMDFSGFSLFVIINAKEMIKRNQLVVSGERWRRRSRRRIHTREVRVLNSNTICVLPCGGQNVCCAAGPVFHLYFKFPWRRCARLRSSLTYWLAHMAHNEHHTRIITIIMIIIERLKRSKPCSLYKVFLSWISTLSRKFFA